MSLCLAAGALSAAISVQAFTLAWVHSVQKTRWEEDWQIVAGQLLLRAARIHGTGAGMEPPENAEFRDGQWHFLPTVAPQRIVRLTHSPYTAGYQLCIAGKCQPLADALPGIDDTAIIELTACDRHE